MQRQTNVAIPPLKQQIPPRPPAARRRRFICPQRPAMRVLCINAGSSSVKVALYEVDSTEDSDDAKSCGAAHAAAAAAAASSPDDGLDASEGGNLPPGVALVVSKSLKQDEDPSATLKHFVEQQEREEQEHHAKLAQKGGDGTASAAAGPGCEPGHPHPIRLVVHRIVHGGTLFHAPTLLTPENVTKLETLNDLAPLHNPPALKWIRAADKALCHPAAADGSAGKEVRQVAIFDTSFFHELPPVSQAYALPLDLLKKHHIRRYGFHGLAHEDMLRVLSEQRRKQRSETDSTPVERGGRLVTLQLGSGCSAAAVLNGHPQDTSMGFSPLEGLMMATRCGDVDGALLAYLQSREPSLAATAAGRPKALEEMLYYRSGMLGLSGGMSNDMRVLERAVAAPGGNKDAQLALDFFHHRVVQRVGAYVATLGGLDSLAFGGGIGEHGASVRAAVVEQLAKFLPVRLDAAANEKASKSKNHTRISTPDSAVEVWVVKVDEAAIMLRDALTLTQPRGQQSQL